MTRSFFLRLLTGALILLAPLARGQFTSQYANVFVLGNFNGYDTQNSGMRLVSNGTWQGYVTMTNFTGASFVFCTNSYPADTNTPVWALTNQASFSVPLTGTASLLAPTSTAVVVTNGSDVVTNIMLYVPGITITDKVSGILRFTFNEQSRAFSVKTATAGTAPTEIWINEFHYDNMGTDTNEGIEIAGAAGTTLSGYTIVKYNGSSTGSIGKTYGTNVLEGALTNGIQNGLGTKFFAISGLQNGDPDGFALVKGGTNVIQFLSYGGIFFATNGPASGTNGPTSGMLSTDIGVQEDNGSTPVDYSLQLIGPGSSYGNFTWSSPLPNSRNQINSNQLALAGPSPASLVISNLTTVPGVPVTGQTVKISANITGQSGASNFSATAFYRIGATGSFLPLAMTNSGNTYVTSGSIAAQPAGTLVYYDLFVNFDGPGTNSPTISPSSPRSYGVSAVPAGTVWINEVNPETADPFTGDDSEFVEIAGLAGSAIGCWTAEVYSASALSPIVSIPLVTVLPNDVNGFGFYVIGDATVANVDQVFPGGYSGDNVLNAAVGAVRLLDQYGNVRDFIWWGETIHTNTYPSSATYVGNDPNPGVSDEIVLGLSGTASNRNALSWITVTNNMSPGAVNLNESLINGNTGPIPPFIQCLPDQRLPCPTNAIPTNNPASVVATGYCGNGSVTVTWTGDVTNNGTGCKGNPKIITRTYRAVSACATTSTCSQLFILEDTNPPTLNVPTQALVNADFEAASTYGWQTFGVIPNNSVNGLDPHSGTFHGILPAPYGVRAADSSGNAYDGIYTNGVLRTQTPPAVTSLLYSAYFDGTDDYVNIPPATPNWVLGNTATITAWIKRNGSQQNLAGIVFSRGTGSNISGLDISSANDLHYHWNAAANTYNWSSGIVPPDTNWVFVALTISPTQGVIYARISNQWVSAVNFTNHTPTTFDGAINIARDSAGGRQFKGHINDVQIYGRTLTFTEVTNIWNNGLGDATANNPLARWKLNDYFQGGTVAGLQQELPATNGQSWVGGIWAKNDPINPLQGTNTVSAAIQFLNAGGTLLSNASAAATVTLASGTIPGASGYTRLLARGIAPTNTAKVRVRISYQQDTVGNIGSAFIDDAFLSDTFLTAGSGLNQCGTLPNFTTSAVISASDNCGSVTLSQIPVAGTKLTNANMLVTITANDSCGNSTSGSFNVFIDDTTPPLGFSITPSTGTTNCYATRPTLTATSAFDNCAGYVVNFFGATTNFIPGCATNGKIYAVISNVYQMVDLGGNTKIATQVITAIDTNPPVTVLSASPDLNNGGFESAAFTTNWQTFGNALVTNLAPFAGSYHAMLNGQTNGAVNSNGIYQTLSAQAGQNWRLGAWVMMPTNNVMSPANYLETKLDFFDAGQTNLETDLALAFTSNSAPAGLYRQIHVNAIAPFGATSVRATFTYIQSSNAPGTIFIDAASLSRTIISAPYSNGCATTVFDYTNLMTAVDCGYSAITQYPPVNTPIYTGTNIVSLYAFDNCGNSRTGIVAVVAMDDEIPLITTVLSNMTVGTTNAIPDPTPGSIVAIDCSSYSATNLPDRDNGGAGTTNDPLIVTRTYRVTDAWGNAEQTQQVFTVNGTGVAPPAPTNVAITTLTIVATPGATNTIRSTGTNTWNVIAEYTTNLMGAQFWQSASNASTVWSNGTNITTFTIPTNAIPAFLRVKQTYP